MNTLSLAAMSDEQLWQISVAGNREAFEQIVTRHQSLICSLSYCACGDLSRSEDIAQETFLAAWQRLAELREPAKLRAWLCGIARNLSATARRRETRRGVPASMEDVPEQMAPEADPAVQAVTEEEAALLWRTLAGLPESYREPMVLFYREQQSIRAVAAGLDLSEEVVRQRLSRGRALLRDDLTMLVEVALARTRPRAGFTLSVLACLPVAKVAGTAGVVGAKGATVAAKGTLTGVGAGALLGPAAGLLTGWLGIKAVELTARSEQERVCVRRHARGMVLCSFALCGALVLTLSQAGKLYPATGEWLMFGILAWVGILVWTILWLNSRMRRDVARIRAQTGTEKIPHPS